MADTKVYLPRQEVTRGKAGYAGKDIVIVERSGRQVGADEDAKATKAKAVVGTKKADGE